MCTSFNFQTFLETATVTNINTYLNNEKIKTYNENVTHNRRKDNVINNKYVNMNISLMKTVLLKITAQYIPSTSGGWWLQ